MSYEHRERDYEYTYRGSRYEVCHSHQIAGMRINKRLEPGTSLLVLDLQNMSKNKATIWLRHELESRWMLIERSRKRTLCLRNGFGHCNRGSNRSNGR